MGASAYMFQPVTVADALAHANAWISAHPKRAEGYFYLAGVHGSAWAKGATGRDAEVESDGYDGDTAETPPTFVPWNSIMFPRKPGLKITPEALQHLGAAIAAYRKAVDLDPKNLRNRSRPRRQE
jgi:hypothetical protein